MRILENEPTFYLGALRIAHPHVPRGSWCRATD
jgi:hypothetical protein